MGTEHHVPVFPFRYLFMPCMVYANLSIIRREFDVPISKKFLKSRPTCKVRFVLPAEQCPGVESVCLVGEFNGWNVLRNPMKKTRDGSFAVEIELETGREYRFRYLLDGTRWANDSDADGYEYCPFANADNALVNV